MNHKYKKFIGMSVASLCMAVSISAQADTYSIGTVFGKDHAVSRMSVDFSERVKDYTDGDINVRARFGSPFGDVYQIGKQVANGQRKIDVVTVSSDIDPRLTIGYMGGLVYNYEQAEELYGPDGDFMKLLNEIGMESGYKYLAWAPTGFGGIAFREEGPSEIPSPQRYKTRSAPYKSMINRYAGLGFDPVPMAYSETYTALQTGAIDAKGATPPEEAYQVFSDVMGEYVHTRDYFEGIIGIAVNLDWYENSLSDEQRAALDKAGKEATANIWKGAKEREEEFLDKLRAAGVKVTTFSDEEYKAISDLVKEHEWPEIEKLVGPEMMDRIRDMAY
jgi:TRAP-type C4-dicarboxylate transport system substrate-binding protein